MEVLSEAAVVAGAAFTQSGTDVPIMKNSGEAPEGGAVVKQKRKNNPEGMKKSILDAAVSEFALSGFSGTTLDAIAERAGIIKRMVVYYLPSVRRRRRPRLPSPLAIFGKKPCKVPWMASAVQSVEEGVVKAGAANKVVAKMVMRSGEVKRQIGEITQSMQEQSQALGVMSANIERVANLAESSYQDTSQLADGSRNLHEHSQKMVVMLNRDQLA